MKFKVPIRVSVAPVQTYARVIEVEAASREEARLLIMCFKDPGNTILSDAIGSPGWKSVGGRLGPILPHLTTYDIYLAEDDLEAWAAHPAESPRPQSEAKPSAGKEARDEQHQSDGDL